MSTETPGAPAPRYGIQTPDSGSGIVKPCRSCGDPIEITRRQSANRDYQCRECAQAHDTRHSIRLRRSSMTMLASISAQMRTTPGALLRDAALARARTDFTGTDPSINITVRVKDSEMKIIESAAKIAQVPTSTYIRDSSLAFMAGLLTRPRPVGRSAGDWIDSSR